MMATKTVALTAIIFNNSKQPMENMCDILSSMFNCDDI